MAKMAKPLTELTKKEGFKWSDKAQAVFEWPKDKLTTTKLSTRICYGE